jgi:hypothetical protein
MTPISPDRLLSQPNFLPNDYDGWSLKLATYVLYQVTNKLTNGVGCAVSTIAMFLLKTNSVTQS